MTVDESRWELRTRFLSWTFIHSHHLWTAVKMLASVGEGKWKFMTFECYLIDWPFFVILCCLVCFLWCEHFSKLEFHSFSQSFLSLNVVIVARSNNNMCHWLGTISQSRPYYLIILSRFWCNFVYTVAVSNCKSNDRVTIKLDAY